MSSDNCPMEVKGGATSAQGKVNILLQAHISKVFIEDFALVSDAAYVAQNAGRIIRALLEIALSRNWANCTRSARSARSSARRCTTSAGGLMTRRSTSCARWTPRRLAKWST
jgi:hypothetical protein